MSEGGEPTKLAFEPVTITLRDGREVSLCAGGPEDAAALLAYMHRCLPDFSPYVAMEPGEFNMTEQQERDWLASQADAPGSLALLAWANEKIVAILNCSCRSDRLRLSIVGHLGISSDKAYWGSGLGTQMMSALIDWAERNPTLELLELDVMADNDRAIALYRSAGFVDVGVVPGRGAYPEGIRKDNLFMYRRVDGAS